MTVQNSVAVRDARLDAFAARIGPSPRLELRSGPQPADCGARASGTLLAIGVLPSAWLEPAANGRVAKRGEWRLAGTHAGRIGHYRLCNQFSGICHEQGSVSLTDQGGDMTVERADVVVDQAVTVTGYTRIAGNE